MEALCQDLETQGQRPGVLKPLIVLSDTHMEYGRADGFEAQSALLWSEVAHLYPILIAAGDNEMFAGVKQTRTREVVVDGTEDSDLYDAFQVAGEHLQASFAPLSWPIEDFIHHLMLFKTLLGLLTLVQINDIPTMTLLDLQTLLHSDPHAPETKCA